MRPSFLVGGVVLSATTMALAAPPVTKATEIAPPHPKPVLVGNAAPPETVLSKLRAPRRPLPTVTYTGRDVTLPRAPALTPAAHPQAPVGGLPNGNLATLASVASLVITGDFSTSDTVTMAVNLATPASPNGSYFLLAQQEYSWNANLLTFSQDLPPTGRAANWKPVLADSYGDYAQVISVAPNAHQVLVQVHRNTSWLSTPPHTNDTFFPRIEFMDNVGWHSQDAGPSLPGLVITPRTPSSVTLTPSPADLQATNLWTVVQEKIHVTATYPVPVTGRVMCFQWPWLIENVNEAFVAAGAVTPNPLFETLNDPANRSLFRYDAGPPAWCATVGADNTVQFDLPIRRRPQNANVDSTEDFTAWDYSVPSYLATFRMAYHARKVTNVSCVHATILGNLPGPVATCTATLEQAAPSTGYKVYGLLLNGQTVPPFLFTSGATVATVSMTNAGPPCGLTWDTRLVAPKDREGRNAMMTTIPAITDIMVGTSLTCR
jgi:hypothetical protein